jgi:hypothetical protein
LVCTTAEAEVNMRRSFLKTQTALIGLSYALGSP